MAETSIKYCGLHFKNPVLMSSADHTWTLEQIKTAFKNNAAGVVTKSLSSAEEMREQFHLVEHAIINENREPCKGKIPPLFTLYGRSGMVQEQPEEWIEMLVKAQNFANGYDGIVIGSVHGTTTDTWVRTAKMMEQAGLKIIELDAGCPHPDEMKEVKDSLVRDIIFAGRLAKAVKEAVKIPVVIKLTPQLPDLVEAAQEVKKNGVDAVVINNRFLVFLVDIETGKPYLNGWAGVGGPWILPLTLRWVSKVYQAVDIQISGSAGPKDWRDVVQFMMSGATTVQFCSAIMVHGYKILPEIVSGVEKFLDRKGYKKVEEIIGIATKAAMEYSDMYDLKRRAKIDYDSCTTCQRCMETCWYNGLVFEDGQVKVTESCKGCQICRMVCPVPGTITMEGEKIALKKLEPQIW